MGVAVEVATGVSDGAGRVGSGDGSAVELTVGVRTLVGSGVTRPVEFPALQDTLAIRVTIKHKQEMVRDMVRLTSTRTRLPQGKERPNGSHQLRGE
mgnify:CR=1 FL=1